jgi:chorismate mutase/prephenate dehydrogenase
MNSEQQAKFNEVRDGIDEVDRELVELIARRLDLTGEVGKLKAGLQLPLYDPQRETELINDKRQLAEKRGVSPELIEDLLRRVMRESYINQSKSRAKVETVIDKNIVVVGGRGKLGSLFVKLFKESGYNVSVLETGEWDDGQKSLQEASLVLVSVPIKVTDEVIKQLSGLPADCVLADLTSIKLRPLKLMLEVHKGPVIGLHPMFGPGINHLAKQNIVACSGRRIESDHWLLEQLRLWGANVTMIDAKQHDELMGIVQVLRHFSTIAYGYHLKAEDPELQSVLSVSSPIYRLELAMVGRLFAQDSGLYSDIIFSNPDNIPMIKRFIQRLNELLVMLENKDIDGFKAAFAEVTSWFGSSADLFLQESNRMLSRAQESSR